ncbi:molybdopterin-dependent oxidoreductase [bacterium]|nr:molybdopterin-dependent oxidoreductase [bacterium]
MSKVPVFCGRDCGGDACPLLAEVEGGKVLQITHNPAAGPYVRGCAKGFDLAHFHDSPERIKTPLLRTGPRGSGEFAPISWDEALDRVHRGLVNCRALHGDASILCLSSAGSTGALHNTERLTRRYLNFSGGCTVLDASYSSAAASYALKRAFGGDYGRSGFDAATMAKSSFIVLWGANVLEARLGAELPARLAEARRRGVPVLSIDPRRTRTLAALGAEWLPIYPGTDVALMYALLFQLHRDGRIDRRYVEARAAGFGELLDFVTGASDGTPKTPEWAAAICGVRAETIVGLARRWADAEPTMLIPGYSIQRTESGEEAARLCVALQLATGNFGIPGGSTGSLNNRLPAPRVGSIGEGDGSRNAHVPIVRWADAILEGPPNYPSRIRAIYSAGGNFLNQGADIAKNRRAFAALDFAVCHELFMTPTACWCDIVLPAASPLQKEDIGIPWAGNYLLYKPQALPRGDGERSDYEIFAALAERAGLRGAFTEGRSESQWIDAFLEASEVGDIETFKREGIYFGADQERAGLADFAADPGAFPLGTASGKVELEDRRWTAWKGAPGGEAFLLVTPKRMDRVHSQGGDYPRAVRENRLEINVEDAAALGLAAGDLALIESVTGKTTAEVALSGSIVRGVVSLPEGSWFAEPSAGGEGALPAGASNALTSTEGTLESRSCVMHGVAVTVRKA